MYEVAANLILFFHFIFILFVVIGALLSFASPKIIFIHVPTAFLAINIYFMMLLASIIWLIRRHHVSLIAAKSAALITSGGHSG